MIDIRRGFHTANSMFLSCAQMIKRVLPATVEIVAVLAILPALFRAYVYANENKALLTAWDAWHNAFLSGNVPQVRFISLAVTSIQGVQGSGNSAGLVDLLYSLLITPLFFATSVLLWNDLVRNASERLSIAATRMTLKNIRKLIFVAIICMLVQSVLGFLPAIAMELVSVIAGLLSLLPFIGSVSVEISFVLTTLVSLILNFAINTLFCYVWICALCEECSGISAIARSVFYLRGNAHDTIATLLVLTLCKWLLYIVISCVWLFFGAMIGISSQALVYIYYCVEAVFSAGWAALACALYQGMHGNANRSQYVAGEPQNLAQMKRANINE